MNSYACLRPLLFCLDAEKAHHLTLQGLAFLNRFHLYKNTSPSRSQGLDLCGIHFPNKIGLAAGLDKDGEYIDALASLGFGFIEVGTVTPRPQPGNPRPRLFRLRKQQAIINRMGFNNKGVDNLINNLQKTRWQGIIGINIGRNKDTPNEKATDDYLLCLERVYPYASYITINISSPNTKGLRELQHEDSLQRFIATLKDKQAKLASQSTYKPMFIKIAPDLDNTQIEAMAQVFNQLEVDGVISGNTTIDRSCVKFVPQAQETGGLSGHVLFDASTRVLENLRSALDPCIPIIGVGGINSGARAQAKIAAGANLVQVYSGLVYQGPKLITDCLNAFERSTL